MEDGVRDGARGLPDRGEARCGGDPGGSLLETGDTIGTGDQCGAAGTSGRVGAKGANMNFLVSILIFIVLKYFFNQKLIF